MTQQFMGMLLQKLVNMCRHHSTGIHHGITQCLCMFFLAGFYPYRIQSKCRIFTLNTLQLTKYLPRVDRQIPFRVYFSLC